MAAGLGSDSLGHWYWGTDNRKMTIKETNKPPYSIPSMEEIKSLPWNGFNVISTFSGCGGSSLGYKMAGYKVLWANEFIPAAQDTYRANHPGTILDTRDIRTIQPEEILQVIRMQPGELDLMDGSPPCASFSTAGRREKTWGKVKDYSDTKQRVDDLFFEYIRLLKGIQPKVFVAENVSGLVKGTAKGYFLQILQAMKNCGYIVKAKVLDAQWLGVPQMRQRVFFIGIRQDLGLEPVYPKPLSYFYSVRDVLPEIEFIEVGNGFGSIAKIKSDQQAYPTVGVEPSSGNGLATKIYTKAIEDTGGQFSYGDFTDHTSPTVRAGGVGHLYIEEKTNQETVRRKFTIPELKRICAFPDDFILTGSYAQQWERLGRAVPPVMMFHIASTIRTEILEKITNPT